MKKISDGIKIDLTPIQRGRLQQLDARDLSPFIKHAETSLRKQGLPVLVAASEAEYALKQYYALAAINPNNLHAVSHVVDPYWHSHILHTKEYGRFCYEVLGYHMHHDPLDHTDTDKANDVLRVYSYTLDILRQLFGDAVNPQCYPPNLARAEMVCLHYNCDAICGPDSALYQPDERFAGLRERLALAV